MKDLVLVCKPLETMMRYAIQVEEGLFTSVRKRMKMFFTMNESVQHLQGLHGGTLQSQAPLSAFQTSAHLPIERSSRTNSVTKPPPGPWPLPPAALYTGHEWKHASFERTCTLTGS